MVAKITIFEPHLEGAQFGPRSIGFDETATDESDIDTGESDRDSDDGSSRRPPLALFVVGLVVLVVAGALAVRKMRGDDTDGAAAEAVEHAIAA